MTKQHDRADAPKRELLIDRGLEIFRAWELRYPANDCDYANPIDARELVRQLVELALGEKVAENEK